MKQNWQRFLLFGVIIMLVAGAAALRPMAAAPRLVFRCGLAISAIIYRFQITFPVAASTADDLANLPALPFPKDLADFFLVLDANAGVADALGEYFQALFKGRPFFWRLRTIAGELLLLDQHVDQWANAALQHGLEGILALLADQIVGIEAVGQERELDTEPGLQVR